MLESYNLQIYNKTVWDLITVETGKTGQKKINPEIISPNEIFVNYAKPLTGNLLANNIKHTHEKLHKVNSILFLAIVENELKNY